MEKVIDGKDQRGAKNQLLEDLDLVQVLDRDVENLSGIPFLKFLLGLNVCYDSYTYKEETPLSLIPILPRYLTQKSSSQIEVRSSLVRSFFE